MSPRPLLLALLALGCSEYDFSKQNEVDEPRDTSIPEPPRTDTEPPVDSGDSAPPPPKACEEQFFPPESRPMVKECINEPIVGTFTPVMEWESSAPGGVYTTPAIGNLTDDNGDGLVDDEDVPDVAVGNVNGVTWVLSGGTGAPLWSGGNAGGEPMSPAIGDLDGDGRPEVVISGPTATIAFRGSDGSTLWSTSGYVGGVTGQCGAVGIHDLDADGFPEVVIGRRILDGRTGALRAEGAYGDGSGHGWAAPMGAAADIDQDGTLEVVVGNALYRSDGSALWYNGQSDGFIATGQFDSDPQGEIVVSNQGSVRLQDDDGSVLWNQPSIAGSTVGPPTVADYDGDGRPEIGVAGNGQYLVLDEDGSLLWSRPTQDYSSGFTGSAVFDFEGDGVAEVVYADEVSVWVFDGPTGAVKLEETRHASATCSEYPAIADVDNDGHAEIIYSSDAYGGGSENGVRAIGDLDDSWQPGRPVWNQHAYSITHVDDDATIPALPATNWLSYNSFRSGDILSAEGGLSPDLLPELLWVCGVECATRDRLLVWARVVNQGHLDVEDPVDLALYGEVGGGWELLETVEVGPVPAGEALEGMQFVVPLDGREITDFLVTVDGGDEGGVIGECDEKNNEARWGEGTCP